MTIKPGEDWGHPVERDPSLRVAASDRQLVQMVDGGVGPVTVTGGDLYRSIGRPRPRDAMIRVNVDLIEVAIDQGVFRAAAHVALYRSLWRGEAIAICNCSEVGSWNLAPRAHPNDGLIDIVEMSATMSMRARWQARNRLATGTHLPHPDLTYQRVTERQWTFDRPMKCFVDGVEVGEASAVSARVIPDAFCLDY